MGRESERKMCTVTMGKILFHIITAMYLTWWHITCSVSVSCNKLMAAMGSGSACYGYCYMYLSSIAVSNTLCGVATKLSFSDIKATNSYFVVNALACGSFLYIVILERIIKSSPITCTCRSRICIHHVCVCIQSNRNSHLLYTIPSEDNQTQSDVPRYLHPS